jgi:nickel/cobalt transporter (NiCoT) family protein
MAADGIFMVKAYSWAFSRPLRKIYYNITTTSLSVAIALVIGTVELLQVRPRAHWEAEKRTPVSRIRPRAA